MSATVCRAQRQINMPYRYFNPNPRRLQVGDCTVRALSAIAGGSWYDAYDKLCDRGRSMANMPSADVVWADELRRLGLRMRSLPDCYPACYTVADFAEDHPRGIYVLAPQGHAVAVIDGCYLDSYDSGLMIPNLYFEEA